MDKIEKFLRRVPHLARRLSAALRAIKEGRLDNLDIKPMQGAPHVFRCRIGPVRILFLRRDGVNIPFDVDFRGNIYKK